MSNYNRIPWSYHVLFWISVLLYYMSSTSMAFKMSYWQLFETYAWIVFIQIIVAYACIFFLIPRFLNRGKHFQFAALLIMLLVGSFGLYSLGRINYLEVRYVDYYNDVMEEYVKLSFIERLIDFRLVMSKAITYLTPTALLLLIGFYKEQKNYSELQEQKKTAELSALKNQLNPHFLFNTLNNLYALSIKKSDKAPEVISKLSDILDYMLYRCNDKFVSLQKEIELIENYIALEKVRYSDRVDVKFETVVNGNMKIAPLILLTFIENAFKHGVSQEINKASIDIKLKTEGENVFFEVKNTIPSVHTTNKELNNSIGLINVKKQLELLYDETHTLNVNQTDTYYQVQLNIKTSEL